MPDLTGDHSGRLSFVAGGVHCDIPDLRVSQHVLDLLQPLQSQASQTAAVLSATRAAASSQVASQASTQAGTRAMVRPTPIPLPPLLRLRSTEVHQAGVPQAGCAGSPLLPPLCIPRRHACLNVELLCSLGVEHLPRMHACMCPTPSAMHVLRHHGQRGLHLHLLLFALPIPPGPLFRPA